jgi:hypothetical protein
MTLRRGRWLGGVLQAGTELIVEEVAFTESGAEQGEPYRGFRGLT